MIILASFKLFWLRYDPRRPGRPPAGRLGDQAVRGRAAPPERTAARGRRRKVSGISAQRLFRDGRPPVARRNKPAAALSAGNRLRADETAPSEQVARGKTSAAASGSSLGRRRGIASKNFVHGRRPGSNFFFFEKSSPENCL